VLRDVLEHLPAYELHEIKRQAAGSAIVLACHAIKDGATPEIQPAKASAAENGCDLLYVHAGSPEEAQAKISDLVLRSVPRYTNPKTGLRYDPQQDVQVITALRKHTPLGAEQLNLVLQSAFGRAPEINRFARGDKVIQTKNEYVEAYRRDAREYVVNGDFGRVEEIDHAGKKLIVRFDNPDRLVSIPAGGEKCRLDLAYAVTVHKYQGSQAPVIIVPIHPCLGIMVPQRNWLYTALSRAESLCIVVGHDAEIARIVGRTGQRRRFTRLGTRLTEVSACK
jgi:exodeoxyribonuclease V alpha subunit